MVVFITTVRHPENAKNFSQIEKLLSLTARSICAQTNQNFKFVIVCNEKPKLDIEHPNIVFHTVDFDPPGKGKASELKMKDFSKDKGSKLLSGILFSHQFNPEYIYVTDADDWLNINIVDCIAKGTGQDVWYSNKGCFVNYGAKSFKTKYGLIRYCGSGFAYKYSFLLELLQIAEGVNEYSSQEQLVNAISEEVLYDILGDHAVQYRMFQDMDKKVAAFPFRSICWVGGTGENHSGSSGGQGGTPFDAKFCSEFGLPDHFVMPKGTKIQYIKDFLTAQKSLHTWNKSIRSDRNYY